MKLSDLTIESIEEFVSGDNGLTPYLTGPKILKLFNKIGYQDVYKYQDGGMPNSLSRNDYVLEKLYDLNGQKKMAVLLKMIVDPRHFAQDNSKVIVDAVNKINPLIQQDGYRFEDLNGNFDAKRFQPTGIYKNIMHHKFCIIDFKTIVHGSYNWTNKARWNKETITIDNSKELAEKFAREFIKLIR